MAIGNWLARVDQPSDKVVAVLRDALDHEAPLVQEHAAWSMDRAVGR